MFQEHDTVVLDCPLPALGLQPGDVGVVVHVHGQGQAYEVEFLTVSGQTIGVETLTPLQVRAAADNAVPHARVPAAA